MRTQKKNYWKNRFEEIEQQQFKETEKVFKQLENAFKSAQKDIENNINKWFIRFAKNNNIDIATAKKWLNNRELAELKWTLSEYIEKGRENAVNQKWIKQLENASAKVHISYFEQLQIELQNSIEELYAKFEETAENRIISAYEYGLTNTAYTLQTGTGVGFHYGLPNSQSMAKVIETPWNADGKNFSARIWQDRSELVNYLHKELTQNLIMGGNPEKLVKDLSAKLNVKESSARRLLFTETDAYNTKAALEIYPDFGIDTIEVLETLDSVTCSECAAMDGKIVKRSEAEIGVNIPPFHPHCRGLTIPYIKDYGNTETRIARDNDGENYYVPANMSYEEWAEKFLKSNAAGEKNN